MKVCWFVFILHFTLSSVKLPPLDVPADSQPSTSPFISSLSLSSSEENIGKKLLRKLSEWATCHERRYSSTPTRTVTCAQKLGQTQKRYPEYLSNRWCVVWLAATYTLLQSSSSGCSRPPLVRITWHDSFAFIYSFIHLGQCRWAKSWLCFS